MHLSALIAYHQKRHLMTLKETALQFGMSEKTLSHLKKGEDTTERSRQKAMRAMGMVSFDTNEETEIETTLNTFFHAILYVNYDEARRLYQHLSERHIDMSNFTPRWRVYQFMYAIHTQTTDLDIESIDHECQLLIPWMNPHEKEIYAMERAGYFFLKGDLSKSVEVGLKSIASSGDDHLRAINLFLIGASGINEVGKIEASMQYLEEAETLFLKFANYKRAIRCQAFEFIGRVHSLRYKDVLPYYETLKAHPTVDDNQQQLDGFIEGTLARYYLLSQQPQKALTILDAIPFKSAINYFLRLVALYTTQAWSPLKAHLNAVHAWDEPINNRVHLALMEALTAWLNTADMPALSSALEAVFFSALSAHDYISIMLISPMAVDALKNAKQYKKAYHLAQETLQILRANS